MDFSEFLHIFYVVEKPPVLSDCVSIPAIVGFFLETLANLGIKDERAYRYYFNNKRHIPKCEWDKLKGNISMNKEVIAMNIAKAIEVERRDYLVNKCGIQLAIDEVVNPYCLGYAILEQFIAIAEGYGKSDDNLQNFYRRILRIKETEKRIEGKDNRELYIEELYRAYGDREHKDNYSKEDCSSNEFYSNDRKERQVHFFIADKYNDQVKDINPYLFADLKEEIYENINEVALSQRYENGYERMLAVAREAKNSQLENDIFNDKKYFVNIKIKKGVCHHLVNDEMVKWVIERNL